MRLILLLLILTGCSFKTEQSTNFSFHLHSPPHSLDPAKTRGTAGNYLLNNLYRSLYRYDNQKGLVPEGAKDCQWQTPKKLMCHLNPNRKWSDGSPVLAQHFEMAFKRLFKPHLKTLKIERLLKLKNAQSILSGKLKAEQLGVKALNNTTLEILFEKPDPNFLYTLTSSFLAPVKSEVFPKLNSANLLITNGPYKIQNLDLRKGLHLISNPYYPGHKTRPNVYIYFVEKLDAAFRLYETGKINFLRLLMTHRIPSEKNKPGFIFTNISRFDHIAFANEIAKNINLRKALAHSLEYPQLAKIYHARGIPGCPSLPKSYMKTQPCYIFKPELAKKYLAKAPQSLRNKTWTLAYNKADGEDIKRGMEWAIYQWKINLGLKFELKAVESGMYLQTLKNNTPDAFRKGVNLERPTCAEPLNHFKKNHPRNLIKYSNQHFELSLKQLKKQTDHESTKKLCSQTLKILMDDYPFIPLGEIHFSQLHDQKFTGWSVNEMNQLDLSQLQVKK